MIIDDPDYHFMLDSLNIQLKLVKDRIEQMQLVEQAIQDTAEAIRTEKIIDWSRMLKLIHLTGMEKSFKNQYQDASNISARINLHSLYSQNKQGWFPWIYEHMRVVSGMQILEIGCGDGELWKQNLKSLPDGISISLSDISEGMLRDARRKIGAEDARFDFSVFDCHNIPYEDGTFEMVAANHMLFYCMDIENVCREVRRVLKPGGKFVCGTYGGDHMKEVNGLVQKFDERIVLSAEKLYERFGRENGRQILEPYFSNIQWVQYEDKLIVPEPEPLIAYILSCHGNQGQHLLNRYSEFRSYVKKRNR